jgi:hypothetical protein
MVSPPNNIITTDKALLQNQLNHVQWLRKSLIPEECEEKKQNAMKYE